MIRGPLGIWTFPLLNILLSILSGASLSTQRMSAENIESWELVRDEKGKLVNVVVHRRVVQT